MDCIDDDCDFQLELVAGSVRLILIFEIIIIFFLFEVQVACCGVRSTREE